MRLEILNAVIADAKKNGDERWKNLIPQQRSLNEQLVAALKVERAASGEPEPEPVTVALKPLRLSAKRPDREGE